MGKLFARHAYKANGLKTTDIRVRGAPNARFFKDFKINERLEFREKSGFRKQRERVQRLTGPQLGVD
jgi:hypothetical protein